MLMYYPHKGLVGDGQIPAQVHKMKNTEDILSQFKRMYLNDGSLRGSVSHPLAVGNTIFLQKLSRTQLQFHKGYKVKSTETNIQSKKIIDTSDKNH